MGMTIKQYDRSRFFEILEKYREAKRQIHTQQGKSDFIALSVQLHIAKGRVPKRLWPLINR